MAWRGTHPIRDGLLSLFVVAALSLAACTVHAPRPLTPADGTNASGGINRPEHRNKPYLILISFDGFRPDYLDRFDLPNFKRLGERGARAAAMIPVFPSLTFPNHYSLVTGLHPEHHGIIENTFFDPDRNQTYSIRDDATVADGTWYRGEPIWVTAEAQGMVAACFFWPGSEAAIKGVRPTLWNKYDGAIANNARVDTVLEWLRLPAERRPHLVTLYFSDMDSVSHRNALDSSAIEAAARSLDHALGALLDGIDALPIKDRIYVLATSDHGMVETSASRAVMLGSLIDLDSVKVSFDGPVSGLHVKAGTPEARHVRDQINSRLQHGRAYLRQEVPEKHRFRADPRIGDVVVIMDESWTLVGIPPIAGLIRDRWGAHGWDPALPSMQAMFIISGPDIRGGVTIPAVHNVDVYPLMTELLGLRAAPGIDGQPGRIRAQLIPGPAAAVARWNEPVLRFR
jgi:predicted AlkP superfamily pyrophosphatase or phosphodiesterase